MKATLELLLLLLLLSAELCCYGCCTEKRPSSLYHPIAFLPAETLHVALSAAAIVISRAGSTTIFETALHGKPSILIPIPENVSHDQRTNAYAYARDVSGESVLSLIEADPMAGREPVLLLSDADWLRLQTICGG